MPPRRPLLERFWEKVRITDGCWEWTGTVDSKGYGMIGSGIGTEEVRSHRQAYTWAYGDPREAVVCHRCDNPLCVRPTHLFTGTQLDNLRDMTIKGRGRRGGAQGPKLTLEQVLELRARGQSEDWNLLAEEYGISRTMVKYTVRRQSWVDVDRCEVCQEVKNPTYKLQCAISTDHPDGSFIACWECRAKAGEGF
jgi:hypothetical protein